MTPTEISLVLLTAISIAALFVQGNDFWPALLYCVISWLLFFVLLDVHNLGIAILCTAASELLLVLFLYGIKQCHVSSLATILVKLSIIGVVVDIFGCFMLWLGFGMAAYDVLCSIIIGIVILLFIVRWRRDGSATHKRRFIRDFIANH